MGSVKVICRFRPVNGRERKEEENNEDLRREVIHYKSAQSVECDHGVRGKQKFDFDRIFQPGSTQVEVYEEGAKHIIEDVLQGYHGCLFAYGQTGAGKSFTMFGADIEDGDLAGIIPRAANHIFSAIEADESDTEYQVKCSFLEIYCEMINDLLNPSSRNLKIHESPSRGIYVDGLADEGVLTDEELMNLLKIGEQSRAVSGTAMNAVSSRSHSVFMITLIQRTADGATKTGRLYLVDLAGSEKVGKTDARGDRLKEAQKINLSLTVLGQCIKAITDKAAFIPFRESKLTRILQDSLIGNCKTTLLIAVSPHAFNLEETITTMKFGQRAKRIQLKAKINAQRSPAEMERIINKLMGQVEQLKAENVKLRKIVDWYKSDEYAPGAVCPFELVATDESQEEEPSADQIEAAREAVEASFDAEKQFVLEIERIQSELTNVTIERDQANAELEVLAEELQGILEENSSLKGTLDALGGADVSPELVVTLQGENIELRTDLENTNRELEALVLELESTAASVDSLTARLEEAQKHQATSKISCFGSGDHGGSGGDSTLDSVEATELIAALQEAECTLQRLEQDFGDVVAHSSSLEQEVADLTEYITQMETEIDAELPEDTEDMDPDGNLEISVRQLQALQRKLRLTQNKFGAADRKNQTLIAAKDQLQLKVGQLTDQIVALKEAQPALGGSSGYMAARQLEEYVSMKSKAQNLDLKLESANRKIKVLEERLEREISHQSQHEQKVSDFRNQIATKDQEIRRLEFALKEAHEDIEKHRTEAQAKMQEMAANLNTRRSKISRAIKKKTRSAVDDAYAEKLDISSLRSRLKSTGGLARLVAKDQRSARSRRAPELTTGDLGYIGEMVSAIVRYHNNEMLHPSLSAKVITFMDSVEQEQRGSGLYTAIRTGLKAPILSSEELAVVPTLPVEE